MSEPDRTTHQKALRLNLDERTYGTIAEIGAGQEVARWFFRAGHAAGTVAKTISAYDMAVSDAIYGHADRYVSRARLEAMLSHELDLLLERLEEKRGERSTFFAFADTVATRRPGRDERGRGWLGVRFQHVPQAAPSEVLLHVTTLDRERVHEQEALGILGVNLIHGAFYLHGDPLALMSSLRDGLSRDRIGVDLIRFSGPAFAAVDNRLMSLALVEQGLADAALFTGTGEVVEPSEILYGKPVLVERGRFRPIDNLGVDMLEKARRQFVVEPDAAGEEPVVLLEMTQRHLGDEGAISHDDFLARVDLLATLGATVLVSSFTRYFRLVEYLCRYTRRPIGLAVGVPTLLEVAREEHYSDLDGGALEAFGRLFKRNVRVYAYPYADPASGSITTIESLVLEPGVAPLHALLLARGMLVGIRGVDPDCLRVEPQEVMARLEAGDPSWQAMVPAPVARAIRERGLFGWRAAPAASPG